MNDKCITQTDIDLPLLQRGKVRDIYDLGDQILIVASDRLSAFDVVFEQGIPGKGRVLTQLSLFWASRLSSARPYHLVSSAPAEMDPRLGKYREDLDGRSMLVEKLEMFPVECVVRGYLAGSAVKDYRATGGICGQKLPAGLQIGDPLPEPLFTPATKAEFGQHDENVPFERVVEILGEPTATELKQRSLEIYREAAAYALQRKLILVDTKLEMGRRPDGTIVLGDEVLTPDSSRYWDIDEKAATPAGASPPSFDKQIVRDYLETLDWNKSPPAPKLPEAIIQKTGDRYQQLVERLCG